MRPEATDGFDGFPVFDPPEFFENQILNSWDAAAYLGISTKTLLKYVRQGLIPAKRVGRSYMFLRSVLIDWMKER